MNTINTSRLVLRPFCDEDASATVSILMDDEVKQTYMVPDFVSAQAAVPLFGRLQQLSGQEDRFVRAICLKDQVIGFLNDVLITGQQIELGYVIAPGHKGRGYATEALTAAVKALFDRGFTTVRCGAFEENAASRRVMEKSGMIPAADTEYIQYRGKNHRCIYYEIKNEHIGGTTMNRAFPEMKKKLGFGMMRLPMNGDEVDYPQVSAMVDAFLAKGFNYFDTATPYLNGQSEKAVRECLAKRYPREAFLLTDKLSPNLWEKGEEIEPLVNRQLENCGVEYFDFYLMHAMNADRHRLYAEQGAYDIVQKLKAEGKIRHMGISFHHSAEALDQILTDRPDIEVVQLQFNYADMEDPRVQSRKCYEVCRKHGKPVLVMEPVKGGSLANLPAEAAALLPDGSPASYAVRFAAGFEGVEMVLSGMSNVAQMEDNLSYMEDFKPLTQKDHQLLEQVKPIYQSHTRIPCTGCRYCEEKCPMDVPISTIFALVNQLHKKEGTPKEDYAALRTNGDDCMQCGWCLSACPQQLQVYQLVEMGHKLLKAK